MDTFPFGLVWCRVNFFDSFVLITIASSIYNVSIFEHFRCELNISGEMWIRSPKQWTIWLLLYLPLVMTGHRQEFCSKTSECLGKVRRLAAQTNRFWFGDNWRINCGGFAAARLREVVLPFQVHFFLITLLPERGR